MTTCGKKIYLTYKHAEFDAREMRRKYECDSVPYRCRTCNAWHVGTQGGQLDRARRIAERKVRK